MKQIDYHAVQAQAGVWAEALLMTEVSGDHFLLAYNQECRQYQVRSVPDPEAGHCCLTLPPEEA